MTTLVKYGPMLQKMGKKELELGQDLNPGHAKKSKVESN